MPFSNKNVNDFLRTFLANIKNELPGNSFRFSDFEAAYNNKKIPITKPDQYLINEDENMSWTEDFKKVMFNICKIINDPRATITSYKEALSVEKIVKIDARDVIESGKKDSYWDRLGSGEIIPKKFTTSINERDICIYENKFVVFVIDMMLEYVTQNVMRMRKNLRNASQQFAKEQFNYKDVEDILDLANFETFKHKKTKRIKMWSNIPLLTSNHSDTIKNLDILESLKKDLLRISFTPFYRTVKKSGQITAERVYSTNLLLGDHHYSEIYNFYLKYFAINRGLSYKAPIYRPWYRDFVVLSLLMAFKELGFNFNQNRMMFDDVHHIILHNYNIEKEGVKVHLDMHDNIIDITFNVRYIEGKFHKLNNLHNKRDNHICLIIFPNPKTLDEVEAKQIYDSLVSKKLENDEYTNAYIVSPHDEFNFAHAVIVSPFTDNVDLSLKNIIQASLVFVEGDSKMYNKFCPICGSRVDGEWDDGNCHCLECNSVWTSLISGDNHQYQNTIWLKAIKRLL